MTPPKPLHVAVLFSCAVLISTSGVPVWANTPETGWRDKVAPAVLASASDGTTEFLVILSEQADVAPASYLWTKQEKGTFVFDALREVAVRTQPAVIAVLDEARTEYRRFWVANMIWARGDRQLVERLARRHDVRAIHEDLQLDRAERVVVPDADAPDRLASGVEWNVSMVNGPAVWFEGVRGAGAVIGSMDTGFEWQHPALIDSYRGWQRRVPDHSYNWHDAIHVDSGPCGPDSPEPCDVDGHGTLTMGTSVGDDGGANQIGLAPEAKWIGCRCWEPIRRTHLSYVSECFQWFIAPTDLNDENPDPAKAPHVVNNSWICEGDEGCIDREVLRVVVQNVRAAGIVVVASAGNSGNVCSSVEWPPATYAAAFSVGATTRTDEIASFSSRGPVIVDGSDRLKPEIVAPGQNVRSSTIGGGYEAGVSGTSLSGPLVAGAVALLISAVPELAGQVDVLEQILVDSAVPRTTNEDCGGVHSSQVPNNTFGHGRLDVYAAYLEARSWQTSIDDERASPDPRAAVARPLRLLSNTPNPFNPGTRIEYELSAAERVTLRIHDVAGRVVRALVPGEIQQPGRYEVSWNGRDTTGREVPSGIYFCKLDAGRRDVQSIRMTLVR